MAILQSKNPNELRKSATKKADTAKALQGELDAQTPGFTVNDTGARIDTLLEEAAAEQAEAKAIEDREAEMAGGRRAPVGNGLPGSARNRPPAPDKRGYMDKHGNPVAVLAANESLGDWYAANGDFTPDTDSLTAGESIVAHVTGREISAAHSGGAHTAGGFLLDQQRSSEVIDLARSASVIMQAGARTVDMRASELVMARVTTDPTVSWVGENETFPTTEAAFGRLTFRARKLGVIVPVSVELIQDAPNAAAIINNLLQTVVAQEIDRVALLGDGDGEEPVGIFNAAGVTENAIGGAVDYDDFLDSIAAIEALNGSPNAAIYPSSVKKSLAQLKVNSEANHYASAPPDFADLSRFVTTKLSSAQAVVGDFTNVMIGIRNGVEIIATDAVAMSDGSGFQKDQVLIKVRWRGDVQFAHPEHLEKLTGIS